MKLLRIEFDNVNRFENQKFAIDFLSQKKVFKYEKEENIVFPINNNVNSLNTLAFVGINATGKTTVLKLIVEILKIYIENESLDYESDLKNYFDQTIDFTVYLSGNENIYKIISRVEKNTKSQELYFVKEQLFVKKLLKAESKQGFLNFNNIKPDLVRDKIDSRFLKSEDSIFSSILNQEQQNNKVAFPEVVDSTETNINFLTSYMSDIPQSYVSFLDNSIESLKLIKNEDELKQSIPKFEILFKNSSEKIHTDVFQLNDYLSSGTIKGLSLLTQITGIMSSGGYLVLDEIENHFNKAIVINLINLFNSDVNKNGATLVFSTHYTEIIDSIDRTDSIYVLTRDKDISIHKLSDLLGKNDRSDKKKSDLILSGAFGTAPTYESYNLMKMDMEKVLDGDV